ncbi:MAG: shikimate kinase [Robiginitalea sp.]
MKLQERPVSIVLLGYMGSGKSRLGRQLAARLGLPFTDLDAYIESEVGMPVPEIFQRRGELFFRKKEHQLLKALLETGEARVLSLGGGTPAYAGNMDLVTTATPHTFYLQHSIPSLVGRLEKEREQRPLIAHLPEDELYDFIGKHLFDRVPFYSQAGHTIFCDGKSVAEILSEIEDKLA